MKCPSCGEENPKYVVYCGRCGSEIPAEVRRAAKNEPDEPVEPAPGESAPGQAAGAESSRTPEPMVACAWCGTLNKPSARYCSYCGKDPRGGLLREAAIEEDYGLIPPKSSPGGLIAGGILSIIAGVLAFGQGLVFLTAESIIASLGAPTGFFCLCGGLDMLFGLAALAAGVFAIQRKHFGLALVGSLLGMLGIGLLVGFVFGLVALILIGTSKDSFEE